MRHYWVTFLWVISAFALSLEAGASPCEVMPEKPTQHHELQADMPCHDQMVMAVEHEHEAPDHETQACCCAALLGNGIATEKPTLTRPYQGLTAWVAPLPDSALSIFLEEDPPPPRL